jgi:hypothetical protein
MDSLTLRQEAEECREKAHSYPGQPEASVLLNMAREFDRLAAKGNFRRRRRSDASGEERPLG